MSGDQQDPGNPKTGYRNPPAEHRFQKGKSGNPKGRPPKEERSLLPRQLRNDVLTVGQQPVRIRTKTGEEEVTATEAVLRSLLAKATSGHSPSIRLYLQLQEKAAQEHYDVHAPLEMVEMMERAALMEGPEFVTPEFLAQLNRLRRLTRKT